MLCGLIDSKAESESEMGVELSRFEVLMFINVNFFVKEMLMCFTSCNINTLT